MKKLMLSAALVAALSAPLLAQPDASDYRPPEPAAPGPDPRVTVPPLATGREAEWLFREAVRLHRDGLVGRAVPIYRSALDKDPGRIEYRPYLALALDQTGRPDLAIEQYDLYLRVEPTDTVVRLNRVVARLHLGDVDTAGQELEALKLTASGDASYQNLVGLVALKKGQYPEAEAAFKQALTYDPHRSDTAINLALVHLYEGHGDEARAELEAVRNAPEPLVHTDLGVILVDQHKMPDALKLFEGAWIPQTAEGTNFQKSVPEALLDLATGLAREGRNDEALLVAAKLVDAMPDRPDAHVLYARLLEQAGRYPLARKEIDQALTAGPRALGADWPYALEVSGIINLGLNEDNAARTDFEQVVMAHPESVSARHNLALALGRLGSLEDAIEQEQAARALEPANRAIWYHLGVLYDLDDKPRPALEAYRKFLQLAPKDPAANGVQEHIYDLETRSGAPHPPTPPPPPPKPPTNESRNI